MPHREPLAGLVERAERGLHRAPECSLALLVVNRRSGARAANLTGAIAALEQSGIAVERRETRGPDEMAAAIRRERGRIDHVIIAGGDGTVSAAAEALLETRLPLGILPVGTGNDLARSLGLPRALPQAAAVIAGGHRRRIDVGRVEGRPFLTAVTIGIGADVLRRLTPQRKRRWRALGYLISGVESWFRMRPFDAHVTCDGETVETRAVHLAIGNGRHYGGGLSVAGDGAIDDGRLDLACFRPASFWRMLALLPGLLTDRLQGRGPILALQGREIAIRTERPMPINADGEITGETPARLTVCPGALEVFAPDPQA